MNATQAYIPRMGSAQPINPRLRSSRLRSSQLRLTRRGRAVLTSFVAGPLVALVLSVTLNGGMAVATSDLSSGAFEYVTVQSGQSLWALAESVAPSADPRDVVSEIVSLNQLENSELHPGDRIAIPIKYSR